MSLSIAVITPPASAPVTPLLPARTAKRATEWEWYHRCLSAVGEVSYWDLSEWQNAAGFDVVLVHEGIDLASAEPTIPILERLANRNGKLIWVEPHHRTTFSASVFDPRFFDAVDRVAKYQLMDYPALVEALRSPENNLAPWPFYGHSSVGDYYADRKLFALPTSPETFQRHLSSDLTERYGSQIVPMMRLFTLPAPTSWYGGSPSRQSNILKESQVGIPLGEWSAPSTRGMIAGLIAQTGLNVKIHGSKVRAAATSEACVAIGPAHLDGGAADVLRFETLAILPEDPRYLIWDDVFAPYESYLPLRGFGQVLRRGGRMIDGEAVHRLYTQLADDLSNAELRERILAGQRRAYELLTDPCFVAAKLGIETPAPASPPALATAAPAASPAASPAPRGPVVVHPAAPARIGSISTDQISVVIQGAIGRDDLPERVVESVRRHLPGAEVVLSTWEGERALELAVDQRLESVDPGAAWQIHEEWPCNTNRLLVSTRAGLQACTRPLALKLRSDTPLTGTGFLQAFERYPARANALRLLRDRMVVINYYCWNPASRPYGLFSVADTVNFGWADDVRRVWDRPLDEEPANSTWFESHGRPKPDLSPWAGFRYTPEQLLWLGFLRQHVDVPFEHFSDSNPVSRLLAELAMANNLVVLAPEQFGVGIPKFAGRDSLEPDALYTHAMWEQLFERYCLTGPNPAAEALLTELNSKARSQSRLEGLAKQARTQATTPHPLEGAREFVVLVDAEELLESEELLHCYAAEMSGSKAVTLAIDASRLPVKTAEHQLRALVERGKLTERDDIDLLAVIGAQDDRQRHRMLRGAKAVYRRHEGDAGELPVFTPGSLSDLRALAETSRRTALVAAQ